MKILRRLLIALVIVVALVALGDRAANAVAERRIAAEVAAAAADHGAHSDRRPDVTIHGWPFLDQAWTGEFEQIDITLSDVGANGLVFPELDLVARDVRADWRELRDGGGVVAGTLEVDGTVSAASVEALLAVQTGFDLEIDDEGNATVHSSREFAGTTVELEASGEVVIDEDGFSFTPDSVEPLTGDLPPQAQSLVQDFADELSSHVALPELPYGIALEEVAFDGDVVTVSGRAEDVPLT